MFQLPEVYPDGIKDVVPVTTFDCRRRPGNATHKANTVLYANCHAGVVCQIDRLIVEAVGIL